MHPTLPLPLWLLLWLSTLVSCAIIDQEGLPDTGLDTSTWTARTLPPIDSCVDLNDMQFAAKNILAPADYAYYRTAALDEIAYTRNMLDWNKIRVNSFGFQDVSNLNLKTSILGYSFASPFFIAPAAQAGRANAGAETNLVKAAGAAGILYVPSIASSQSTATIGAAAVSGQVMFHQEYVWDDDARVQSDLNDIQNAGFKAIFLTVDNTGVAGIRDRNNRFGAGGDTGHSNTLNIAALSKIRNMTSLPIVPKGVKSAHDVKLLADLGFPAVYISNHGGRVVDLAPTAIEILLDLHRLYPEVFNQIEIYADGGVRRATHVLTLLALGVRAVGIGRPAMFANVFGQPGVKKVIDVLNLELSTTMKLMGEANVDRLRGNSSFINTRQLELEFFGAPLGVSLDSTPMSLSAVPSGSGSSTAVGSASSSSASAGSSTASSSTGSSSTASTSTASSSSASSSGASSSTSTSTTTTLLTTSTTTSSTVATATATLTCPGSNNTIYTAPQGNKFQVECGIDHSGGDLSSASVSGLLACVNLCDSTVGCVDVSLSGSACYLKKTLGKVVLSAGIQGAKVVT